MRTVLLVVSCITSLVACGPSRRTVNAQPLDPTLVVATDTATWVANGRRRIMRFDADTGPAGIEFATFDADVAGFSVDAERLVVWTTAGNLLDVPFDDAERKEHGPFPEVFAAATLDGSLLALVRTANDARGPIAGLLGIDRGTGDEGNLSSPHREPTDFSVAGGVACWLDRGKRVFDAIGTQVGFEEAKLRCWWDEAGAVELMSTAGALSAFHHDGAMVAWSDGRRVTRRSRVTTPETALDAAAPSPDAEVVQLVVEGQATWVRWLRSDGKGDLVRVNADGARVLLSNESIRGDVSVSGGKAFVPFADRVEEVTP